MTIKGKKSKRGRKSEYKKIYNTQAYKLTLLGAKDTELADFFGVSEKTINTWKKQHPDFLQSIKGGKKIADSNVAESLYKRALGYEFNEKRVEKEGKKILKTVTTKKEIAPDPVAAIFWLKNRQPQDWRDKQEHEVSGKNGKPIETITTIDYSKLSDAALREIINSARPEEGKG